MTENKYLSENTSQRKQEIDLNNFIMQDKIGEGSFGKVYKVKEKKTYTIYAAKISTEKLDTNSMETIKNLTREINIISKLNHPTVLKFIGFSSTNFMKKLKPVILTELASGGSLKRLINDPLFNDTQILIIIYGIASAMSYLHSHNVIHRDLKPENILLDEHLIPKIADFGLSKMNNQTENLMLDSTISIKGTPMYMSPEI